MQTEPLIDREHGFWGDHANQESHVQQRKYYPHYSCLLIILAWWGEYCFFYRTPFSLFCLVYSVLLIIAERFAPYRYIIT